MALLEFIDSVGTGLVMKCLVVHPWREAAPGTANLAESCFGIVPTVNIALLGVIDSPGILALTFPPKFGPVGELGF